MVVLYNLNTSEKLHNWWAKLFVTNPKQAQQPGNTRKTDIIHTVKNFLKHPSHHTHTHTNTTSVHVHAEFRRQIKQRCGTGGTLPLHITFLNTINCLHLCCPGNTCSRCSVKFLLICITWFTVRAVPAAWPNFLTLHANWRRLRQPWRLTGYFPLNPGEEYLKTFTKSQ